VDIWRAMAEGITDAIAGQKGMDNSSDYDRTFMTYHCYASSSRWFAEDEWIDMHTWGSYHERKSNERAYLTAWHEWDNKNHKPFVNSEPAYEQLPINYDWANISYGRFDASDMRQVAYWSVFAGAAGHTYGGHEVWQMYKKDNPYPPLTTHNQVEWDEAMEYEGANQIQHLKALMEFYDFFSRKPDLDVIAVNPNDPSGKLVATRGNNYIMVYAPTGKNIYLNKLKVNFNTFKAYWFNPQDGKTSTADHKSTTDTYEFNPPGEPLVGNDWVLILSSE
jgi:hypothetical protein